MIKSAVCRSVCQTSMLLAVVLYKVTWKVLGLGANKISAPGLTGELIGEIVKLTTITNLSHGCIEDYSIELCFWNRSVHG